MSYLFVSRQQKKWLWNKKSGFETIIPSCPAEIGLHLGHPLPPRSPPWFSQGQFGQSSSSAASCCTKTGSLPKHRFQLCLMRYCALMPPMGPAAAQGSTSKKKNKKKRTKKTTSFLRRPCWARRGIYPVSLNNPARAGLLRGEGWDWLRLLSQAG